MNAHGSGAPDRNRTCTALRPADFKSAASTSFATRAGCWVLIDWRLGSESNRRTRLCRPLHDHSAA